MEKEEKPPLGVKSRFIWEEECRQKRIVDLRNAMNRFIEAKRDIPYLWVADMKVPLKRRTEAEQWIDDTVKVAILEDKVTKQITTLKRV